jgi:molecular chaperone DnaK (HSP70)
MGSHAAQYEFRAANKSLSAPELGGLIIGALSRAYQDEVGEDLRGAVVALPTGCDLAVCEGMRNAARAGGLTFAPLVQEPLAAICASYMASPDTIVEDYTGSNLLVFDIGGGTLDVSLMCVREGRVDVASCVGDNRLGQRVFDREVLAYTLSELRKQYALVHFAEGNPQFRQAWRRLELACKQAQDDLLIAREAMVEIDDTLCIDERGCEVRVAVSITRLVYVDFRTFRPA